MTEQTISVVSLTIGLMSLAASIVFFLLARKSERITQDTLDSINKAIQEWQNRIMSSAIEMLESNKDIIGKRAYFEDIKIKHSFWNNISENIKHMIEHPATGEDAKAHYATINLLLGAFLDGTKSPVPPEILAGMLEQNIKKEQNKPDNEKTTPKKN
jgi:hypothetical protein